MMMNGQQQQQHTPASVPPQTPGPAYDLQRSAAIGGAPTSFASTNESLDFGSQIESSEVTYSNFQQHPQSPPYRSASNSINSNGRKDATHAIHEMHLALLYLLSNPEEFHKALQVTPREGATTLAEWNAEYEDADTTTAGGDMDDDDDTRGHRTNSVCSALTTATTAPLPYVVFADDAEVVLPQAHTASQLFGIERYQGIELEAAAGIPAISQLFLRWLALMPSGDHLNIIDPPGLTVMRIAGGRYRVTAAHRVVWTWMNEFAALSEDGLDAVDEHEEDEDTAVAFGHDSDEEKKNRTDQNHAHSPVLRVGDLVTMTIVDVFETDNNGKLLSYCPTFDNRAIHKTTVATETLRKSSTKLMTQLSLVAQSKAAQEVNKAAVHLTRLGFNTAKNITESVIQRVDEAIHSASPQRRENRSSASTNSKTSSQQQAPPVVHTSAGFEKAMKEAEAATTLTKGSSSHPTASVNDDSVGEC